MSFKLSISEFKCFKKDLFDLKKLNVLTGNNGAGKSSLIQAILLSRVIIENTCFINKNGWYSNSYQNIKFKLDLNNNYCLNLGAESDVAREDNGSSEISFGINDDRIALSFNQEQTDYLSLSTVSNFEYLFNPLKNKEFYYLNAERQGPRHAQNNLSFNFLHCGSQGENTAHAMLAVERTINYSSAALNKGDKFKVTLDKWMDFVFPNIVVSALAISSTLSQIILRTPNHSSDILSTNIGFGISYALPILVNGLLAQENSLFIVENPEAHLHPKAQSNIGVFLGFLSLCGINVIIETHSEHVINGIRKILVKREGFDTSDLNILFFKEIDGNSCANYDKLTMDDDGNLSDFPKDFFDQSRQDLFEIRNTVLNGEPFTLF